MNYIFREHLIPSLKGISFETRPCEKIGVVGRTGAGKSSIVAALFRMVELTSGTITIDSVDIKRIGLSTLRLVGVAFYYHKSDIYLYLRCCVSKLLVSKNNLL